VSIAAEDIHVALGVDHRDVAIARCRLSTADQTEFVFVRLSRVVVISSELLSLLHLLVV